MHDFIIYLKNMTISNHNLHKEHEIESLHAGRRLIKVQCYVKCHKFLQGKFYKCNAVVQRYLACYHVNNNYSYITLL